MNILLIHGLGRSPLSVFGLSQCLQRSGYRTALFGYSSRLESYAQILRRLQERMTELATNGENGVIAYSLGGLLVRSALALDPTLKPDPILLLAPPNRPPRIAQVAQRLSPFASFAGDCVRNLADPNFYQQLPPLKVPHTIIAGTDGPRGPWSFFGEAINDGVLTLDEMQMSIDDGHRPIADHRIILLPVQHMQMLNHPLVQATILSFLADHAQGRLAQDNFPQTLAAECCLQ